MAELFRFAAFISYSSRDAAFAKRLHRALETYRIPKSLGAFDLLGGGGKRNRVYPVFRDREELSAGDLGERIEAALNLSGSLIVVCSPNAAASPWVEKEIEHFISLGRKDRIFAIIADTAPTTDQDSFELVTANFPPALRGNALSGAHALQPLAADARRGKDGFRNAILKLVAGLIGVTPGQIIDRNKRRDFQRGSAIFALLLIVASAATGFTFRFELGRAWAQMTMTSLRSQAELAGLADRQTFTECESTLSCPQMEILSGGAFLMGSSPDEAGRFDDESPQHKVDVSRFAIGIYDVTFREWAACVAYTQHDELAKQVASGVPRVGCADTTDSGFGGGDHPVINVSWDDAKGYVRWLNLMVAGDANHGPYRLLSEAEWEFAARAGTSSAYFWGNDASQLCKYANVMTRQTKITYPALQGQLGDAPACEEGFIETSPVGSFKPNPYGLYDIYGDVWQWVQDCYQPYFKDTANALAVELAAGCSKRVLRGGSWRQTPRNLRSARRGRYRPQVRYFDVGFRVARSIGAR